MLAILQLHSVEWQSVSHILTSNVEPVEPEFVHLPNHAVNCQAVLITRDVINKELGKLSTSDGNGV
jgi:hypothetical protein